MTAKTQRLTGIHCVREALRARRRELHCLRIRSDRTSPDLVEIRGLAERAGIPILPLPPRERTEREASNPQGVELEAGPLPEYDLETVLSKSPRGNYRRIVCLDQVEDPQNVGALMRVAEVVAADALVLTRRRAPPLGPALARASAGASEWLPVARVGNLGAALDQLKASGFWVVGADPEGDEELFALPDRFFEADLALLLGAEGRGIRAGVGRRLDHSVRIPTPGRIASLNVATAGAILLFECARRASRKAS
ncbi:MAG: RNA methyltransferase [Myxococcota bacterium]